MSDSEKKLELIERQAERNDMTTREYCIHNIEKWRRRLEYFSTDFRDLTDEEFQKEIDKEIRKRENE